MPEMNPKLTHRFRTWRVGVGFAIAMVAGCYGAEFDDGTSDVFYCQSDDDCGDGQACDTFRCVTNVGPRLEITGPEFLQEVSFGSNSVNLTVQGGDLSLVEANQAVEGEGFIEVRLDGQVVGNPIVSGSLGGPGVARDLDISLLDAGGHRLEVQAMRSDGTPYTNPSATAHQTFFVVDGEAHVIIVTPRPGTIHRAGEDLPIMVAVNGFSLRDGKDDTDCTEAAVAEGLCAERTDAGHTHVYALDDYPECLGSDGGEASCNFGYVSSLKPPTDDSGDTVDGLLEGMNFEQTGPLTITAGLQYNEHDPWPNVAEVEFDQVDISIAE